MGRGGEEWERVLWEKKLFPPMARIVRYTFAGGKLTLRRSWNGPSLDPINYMANLAKEVAAKVQQGKHIPNPCKFLFKLRQNMLLS